MNSWPDVKPGLLADVGAMDVAERADAEPMFVVLLDVAVDVDELAARRNLEDLSHLPTRLLVKHRGCMGLNPTGQRKRLFQPSKLFKFLLKI